MERRKALFTDLDDTLYNWTDSYAPSFRAMVHVVKAVTSIDEEIIIESFRKVYKRRGTLDYSFVVQELDIWEKLGWSKEKILDDVVKNARGTVNRVHHHHFMLYDNVREILKWLKNENIFIIAYTNSPGYIAQRRLRTLQIDSYIDCLAYFYDYEVPVDVPDDVQMAIDVGKPMSSIKIIERFANLKKPDPRPIRLLIEKHQLDKKATFVVGDSLENDVSMAQQAGVIDIWARYGTLNHDPKDLETIRRISTIPDEEKAKNKLIRDSVKPTFSVDSFSEIKQIIGSRQLSFAFY